MQQAAGAGSSATGRPQRNFSALSQRAGDFEERLYIGAFAFTLFVIDGQWLKLMRKKHEIRDCRCHPAVEALQCQ
jgi:hypothetical protein